MSNESKGNRNAVSCGESALGVLQIVFIVLKLCKLVDWSWWRVLIPLWVSLGAILITFIILFCVRYAQWRKEYKR